MSSGWSRRAILASVGAVSLAGCFSNEGDDTSSPESVVEEWWEAIEDSDVDRFRELYHPDSPEHEEFNWDSEDWVESFPPRPLEEITVETRELLEETDDAAVVRDVLADSDDIHQHSAYTHHLRPDDDEWRLWTHEEQDYICPEDEPGDRPADDLPDSCPVSTLDDYSPPDTLSCEAVANFVAEYHEAYILEEEFSPTHERDSVSSRVTGIDRTEYGYTVTAFWSGFDYRSDVELHAERVTDPAESDPPSVETLDSTVLREVARAAAENGDESESVGTGGSEEDAIPEEMRQDFESLPGDDERYVTVDETTVRLWFVTHRLHKDQLYKTTRYYVDRHVVRQLDNGADHKGGTLLECQS